VRDNLERVVRGLASVYDDIFQKLVSLLQNRNQDRTLVIGAFGASNDPKAETYLIELLEDSDPDIRGRATVVLAQMRSEQVVPHLSRLFKDSHSDVRAAAAWASAELGEAVPGLIELLNDPDPRVRAQAAEALGWCGIGPVTHLIQLLRDSSALVRLAAASALGRLQVKEAVPDLFEMIAKGTGPGVAAAWALTQLVDIGNLIHHLIKLLEDSELRVKCEAVAALGFIGRSEAAPHLLQFIKNPPWGPSAPNEANFTKDLMSVLNGPPLEVISPLLDLAGIAAWALGTIGSEEAVPYLMQLLKHPASGLKGAAAWSLGNMGRKEAFPYLIQLLKDPDLPVRGVAAKALGEIGGEEAIPYLLRLVHQPTTPWYTGFGIFWGLLRWRRGSEGVIAFGRDLDQKERNRVEALRALRTISRKQGIRIFLDGSYTKVR
jgi:HEAT repeat protein